MTANTTTSLCRLTVMSTNTRVDLAVPLDLSVAELMANLARTLGPNVADEGAAAGGFVLQRTGEAPLDPTLSLRAAQVGDGDLLHLRMRAAQLPEVAYDDVLDAVATGVLVKSARWSADHTTRACAWGGGAAVLFVVLTCLLSGPSWYASAGISGGLAVLLMGAAGVLDRAYEQGGAALVAAGFSVGTAFASGAMVAGGDLPVWAFGADQLLPGASAAVLFAVVGVVALSRGVPGFTAVIGSGLLAAIGSAVAGFSDLDVAATAAFTAGLALLASPLIPMVSFKLSRMQLPIVPTGADDLRAEEGTVDSSRVLVQAVRADQFMTGLVASLGIVLAGAAVLLVADGTIGLLLGAVLAGITLLRARLFSGRSQRLALLLAALVCGWAVCLNLAADSGATTRLLAVVLPVAGLALLMFALVVVLPGRRYAPPSGRMADIVESLLVLAVLPLILGIIGVYSEIREMLG
ncbi:type VII secretion integral membrane protein EccD [Nocardioides sp. AE5]|uniref:type VII secretion integral membrane protein EccD n=1 Tax=Nocardioides sp. AE5 TaxID=2962573 RepID=UPI0028828E4E|nr:type VII secretion integral membrane protein EccD [Nocardioides sp. AE5]MDT0202163.1 type VII secretion integral membrane protein EccD [Nocardioides sp. AE5]